MRQILPGLLFASLWASASVATKFGVAVVHPLLLANIRFFIAGIGLLVFASLFTKNFRLPRRNEWKQLMTFALLNTTIYLGAFVIAIKHINAGIGSLGVATNPLFIMVMSAFWLKRKLFWYEIAGLALGLFGVVCASYPLLLHGGSSILGLVVLLAGMVSVSAATVYYARIKWRLSNVVVNGWQVLLGGLMLLPFTLIFADFSSANFSLQFWASVLWLIGPVSVAALQLWFFLIKIDAVRASMWLYLCPVFGFFYAWLLLGEPITIFTYVGTALVIVGLYLGQHKQLKRQQ